MKQIWVGHKNGKAEMFYSSETPTQATFGDKYNAATGPFKTELGAKIMVLFGLNNPHIVSVKDAEKLARDKKFLEQNKEELNKAANRVAHPAVKEVSDFRVNVDGKYVVVDFTYDKRENMVMDVDNVRDLNGKELSFDDDEIDELIDNVEKVYVRKRGSVETDKVRNDYDVLEEALFKVKKDVGEYEKKPTEDVIERLIEGLDEVLGDTKKFERDMKDIREHGSRSAATLDEISVNQLDKFFSNKDASFPKARDAWETVKMMLKDRKASVARVAGMNDFDGFKQSIRGWCRILTEDVESINDNSVLLGKVDNKQSKIDYVLGRFSYNIEKIIKDARSMQEVLGGGRMKNEDDDKEGMPSDIKEKFLELANELSPENLTADGERPIAQVRKLRNDIMKRWKELERQVGRKVTEDELY